MRNAKQKLHNMLLGTKASIKCASIVHGDYFEFENKQYILEINYTPEKLESFMNSLDFEYYEGYGGQELFGTMWLDDVTWLTRREYNGSEWWEHCKLPKIPDYLLK